MAAGLNFKDKVAEVYWAIFFIAFLCSLAVIDYEVLRWLKTGKCDYTPFYEVFKWLNIEPISPVYSIKAQSVQKMLLWLLSLPMALIAAILTPVLGELFNSIFAPKNT